MHSLSQVCGYSVVAYLPVQTLSKDKINAANKHRHAQQALLNLGLSESDQSLCSLHNNKLWGKDTSRPAQLGDTK
jgi:hypothetical protein